MRSVLLQNALWCLLPIDKPMKRTVLRNRLSDEQVYDMTYPIRWLLEDTGPTKQLLPCIRFGRKAYYGPAEHFADMSWGEYEAAEHWMRAYAKGDKQALVQLVATLYRPHVKRKRVPFDSYLMAVQASELNKLPESMLMGVYLWMVATHRWLTNDSKYASIWGENGGSKQEVPGWGPVMRAVAGNYIDIDKAARMPLYDALEELLERKKEYQDRIKQARKR